MLTGPRRLSQLIALLLTALLIASGPILGAPPAGKGPNKDDGGTTDPAPELPPVRYRISYPWLPADATGGVWINDINNLGQIVGWYGTGFGRSAFLYDPAIGSVLDLNAILAEGAPEGWHVRSGLAINEWMVFVGNIEQTGSDPLQVRPIAVDLSTANPVVDLLPDVGVDFSYGGQINENGDILGVYRTADGGTHAWVFNPGLYGDPLLREPRDGTSLDMSAEIPEFLALSGDAGAFLLNNPRGDSPAQVAGVDELLVAFRYTLGDAEPERFPELDLYWSSLAGLNDHGTFSSTLRVAGARKNQTSRAPFRYNTALDLLPEFPQSSQDMNSSGDVLLWDTVSRDWGDGLGERYINLDDLVVGTDADLTFWFSGATVDCFEMNDRAGATDSAHITGRLDGTLFVLTPEPVR